MDDAVMSAVGVYPGCGSWVGREGCYTGYYPDTSLDPYLVIFSASGPTHGQMKAYFS